MAIAIRFLNLLALTYPQSHYCYAYGFWESDSGNRRYINRLSSNHLGYMRSSMVVGVESIRDVKIEDLLRREPIQTDVQSVSRFLMGRKC